jgi:hypothetical protein
MWIKLFNTIKKLFIKKEKEWYNYFKEGVLWQQQKDYIETLKTEKFQEYVLG